MKRNIIGVALIIGFILGAFLGLYSPKEEYTYETYVIQPGDTLWGIIVSRSDPNGNYDVNKLIHETREVNKGLNVGALEVGSKIQLPIPK